MDAKFYIKNLNNSSNEGGGSKGVEGNSERLLTIYTTPSYIHIVMSNDNSLRNTVIAIDDIKKSPIKDNLSLTFGGRLLYKEEPIPNSDLSRIEYNQTFHVSFKDTEGPNLKAVKIKDVDNIPQEIINEFGDYYVLVIDKEQEDENQ